MAGLSSQSGVVCCLLFDICFVAICVLHDEEPPQTKRTLRPAKMLGRFCVRSRAKIATKTQSSRLLAGDVLAGATDLCKW